MVAVSDVLFAAGMFVLGALGALLTIYVAQNQPIPEFRPLLDISPLADELNGFKARMTDLEAKLASARDELEQKSLDPGLGERLGVAIDSLQKEFVVVAGQVQAKETDLNRTRRASRLWGFVFYIVLGGAFGALLANRVQVAGLSGDLPSYFAAIVIGATWMSYLTVLGFRTAPEKAGDAIDQVRKEFEGQFADLKARVTEQISAEVGRAEVSEKKEKPERAPQAAKLAAMDIDKTWANLSTAIDSKKQLMVKSMRSLF